MILLRHPIRNFSALLTGFLYSAQALAQAQPDVGSQSAAVAGFGRFVSRVGALTNAAIADSDFALLVDTLFVFFAILLVIWRVWRWANKAASLFDLLEGVMLILFTQVALRSYLTWVDAIWSVGDGMASSLQNGMIGTRDPFFAPQFIGNVLANMYFPMSTWVNPVTVFVTALNMTILSVAMLLLSVVAFASVIWGFWGFTLAKLIGMAFVPFLMYERLSFLFDGWLRFFLGFVVYTVIARLNVVLVACSLAIFLGVNIPFGLAPGAPVELPAMSSIFDAIGVSVFLFVGLLSLFSTGKFAATILSGAGGGGIGGAMGGAAKVVTKAMMFSK